MKPLSSIAYARSGDKGSDANIGVIAYTEEGYQWLVQHLSSEAVMAHFKKLHPKKVVRYELPNLWALNFFLEEVLAGGGSRSLRTDAQGKALGQAILTMQLNIPEALCSSKSEMKIQGSVS